MEAAKAGVTIKISGIIWRIKNVQNDFIKLSLPACLCNDCYVHFSNSSYAKTTAKLQKDWCDVRSE